MGKYKEPKETDIQLQILRYLKALGAYGGKTKTVGIKRGRAFCIDPYLFRGFSDLTCFYNKQLYFIEVKRPGNKQSYEQIVFQQHCTQANITYILAYSLEDVTAVIKPS